MRVLVCGGRDFEDESFVFNFLEHVAPTEIGGEITVLIHGGARGADSLAAEWAHKSRIKAICFKADWRKHGKAAGPIRNQKMLDEGKPDFVIAFPGGRGTADMVQRARAAGVRVYDMNRKGLF